MGERIINKELSAFLTYRTSLEDKFLLCRFNGEEDTILFTSLISLGIDIESRFNFLSDYLFLRNITIFMVGDKNSSIAFTPKSLDPRVGICIKHPIIIQILGVGFKKLDESSSILTVNT